MTISKIIILLFISFGAFAFEFKQGEGSEFVMTSQGQKVSLNIYVTNVSDYKMSVEMHFGTSGLVGMNMYQQFQMGLKGTAPIKVEKGYILTPSSSAPEIMKSYMFHQNRGVQINDFLFNKKEAIDGMFVGDEKIEVPAGSLIAKHYRKSSNGQTVDFWIADQVKPIGLVKLVSKSSLEKLNNYTIELSSLLKNVAPKIDPKRAVPISKATEQMLKIDPKN